jgi:glycosyltransferase involved in cell wall biosynthesis
LVVIGDGPQRRKIQAIAPGNVELLGRRPTAEVRSRMRKARAFLFAGIEDFGIVLAEAQACGTPVIALARGGATEIVQGEGAAQPTGLLFSAQSAGAIVDAVRRFERDAGRFAPRACRENAARFAPERFRRALAERVAMLWEGFSRDLAIGSASR